jgi:hypothetical protein
MGWFTSPTPGNGNESNTLLSIRKNCLCARFGTGNGRNMILRCRKSDLKDRGRDGSSKKAFPLTPPSPSGRGRTCERFGDVRGMLASIPPIEALPPRRPGQHLHDRTPWRTQPFQTSRVVLPLPGGEGWGEGEGFPCRLGLSFKPFAPVLITPKIVRYP